MCFEKDLIADQTRYIELESTFRSDLTKLVEQTLNYLHPTVSDTNRLRLNYK
jgi:hypothetical protein